MSLILIGAVTYMLVTILAIDLYKKIFKKRGPVMMVLYSLFWPITGSITGVIFFFILVYEVVVTVWDSFKGRKPFR